jgi:hypothetical protein
VDAFFTLVADPLRIIEIDLLILLRNLNKMNKKMIITFVDLMHG